MAFLLIILNSYKPQESMDERCPDLRIRMMIGGALAAVDERVCLFKGS